MPNFTTLNSETATVVRARWSRRKKFAVTSIWTPDNPVGGGNVAGFTSPPWPVCYFVHGGSRNSPNSLDPETDAQVLMLINELSCAVVAIDYTPGGFYEAAAQEPDAEFWPESVLSTHEWVQWLREHAADATLLGSGSRSLSADPQRSIMVGGSSGGWDALQLQYSRDGDLPYAGGPERRGDARFGGRFGSRCNFVYVSQAQAVASTFCQTRHASPAPSSYTVSGAHAGGVTSVTVTGGTGRFLRANRVKFNAAGQEYAVRADSASPATALSIYPSLQSGLSGGETVDIQTTNFEKYDDYSWMGGYFFRRGDGRVWQRDATSAAGDVEFDWNLKRQADVDLLLTSDNPRVKEVAIVLSGNSADNLIRSYVATANEFSFRNHVPMPHGTVAVGGFAPAYINLHQEVGALLVAFALDAAGNTSNVAAYLGNTTSNPDTEVGATNWNKGQNADFTAGTPGSVLKAFLQARSFA